MGHWTTIAFVLFILGVVFLLVWAGVRAERERYSSRHRLACPRSREHVECTLVQDTRTGWWVDVASCSAFPDPEEVACQKDCLRILNGGFSGERRGGSPARGRRPKRE